MIDTLDVDLRAAMDSGSDHLELPEGVAQQAWQAGRRARAPQPGSRRRWHPGQFLRRATAQYSRPQLAFAGGAFVIVIVVVVAFAFGGAATSPTAKRTVNSQGVPNSFLAPQSAGSAAGTNGTASGSLGPTGSTPSNSGADSAPVVTTHAGNAPNAPGQPLDRLGSADTTTSPQGGSTSAGVSSPPAVGDSGVTATRVVKTGSLSLTVKKGLVATTITSLTKTTASLGGYVSQSRSDEVNGSPAGSLTLRIPVDRFEDAVTAATGLGHETSLSTNAHDVTGKFVDLNARLSALKRTRSTYLTILSQARTIGQTLSVQQRVNDIQQQIEQRQGELKVLRNQSADGTLTVEVSELGAAPVTVVHHHRSGWSKAWHSSTGRFNRGIQAIIGGLGPLLLALILLALLYVIGRVVLRGSRRDSSVEQ